MAKNGEKSRFSTNRSLYLHLGTGIDDRYTYVPILMTLNDLEQLLLHKCLLELAVQK